MKQRVVSFSKPLSSVDAYKFDLDPEINELSDEGWTIKQVVSTSFYENNPSKSVNPVIVVTLLIEKDS